MINTMSVSMTLRKHTGLFRLLEDSSELLLCLWLWGCCKEKSTVLDLRVNKSSHRKENAWLWYLHQCKFLNSNKVQLSPLGSSAWKRNPVLGHIWTLWPVNNVQVPESCETNIFLSKVPNKINRKQKSAVLPSGALKLNRKKKHEEGRTQQEHRFI